MSSDSLAALRAHAGTELAQLAEQHMQHDLTAGDRDTLHKAAGKFGTHASLGSLLGLGLGIFLAVRVRGARKAYFQAFRAAERPTHVQFNDGRTEALPDLTPFMKPSTVGDVAAYVFFSAGGLFLGGETGMLTGSWSARRTISKDPEAKARIENAFKKFRADVLRQQADRLDKDSGSGILESARRATGL